MPTTGALRTIAACCTTAILLAACGSDPVAPVTLTALPRPLTASEQAVGSAGNEFSFDLMRTVNLDQLDSNVFISPLSASMALGMALNGAAGSTADEMRRALGFGEASQQSINEGYRGLIGLLRGLDRGTDLRVANAIFNRKDFPFEEAFFTTGRTFFDARVEALDFAAPASVHTINDWVSRSTNAKIPEIIDEISGDDVMFLINAVYFKGSWRSRFDPAATVSATFNAPGGAAQPMRLMRQESPLRYFESADVQAVDLLYGNGAFTMTVVLPKPGRDVNELVAGLTEASWTQWTNAFAEQRVDLHLPKLKLEYDRRLNDDLEALGMDLAFIPDVADFTGMSPLGRHLFISYVRQKTYVDIHEEGTEAAAVTAVGVSVTSVPVVPVMRVDRPFIFAIRERFSGTILFMGKVVRMPSSGS